MTYTDEQATALLRGVISDVHCDALSHPDACSEELLRLIHAIEMHASEAERSIQAYAQLAQDSSDPSVTAVMRVLLKDARQHHRQFLSIAASLRDRLYWIPASAGPSHSWGEAWAPRVRAFEAEERRSSEDLRDLAGSTRGTGDVLAGVLLEAMAMDNEKHARLLAFVHQQLVVGRRDQLTSEA